MRWLLVAFVFLLPVPATASPDAVVTQAVEGHILPGFQTLAMASKTLAAVAAEDCNAGSGPLVAAYHDAFDAWVRVSNLRFGPTEVDHRAFALAFWPDPRAKTPKALHQLIRNRDAAIDDRAAFRTVSIAARGFYALERLLFDPAFAEGPADYTCTLIQAIAADIAATARELEQDWSHRFAPMMMSPGSTGPYASTEEAMRELYKALSTGLQFTSDMRLGRPMGTFERPRPKRAEARLSARSLRHVRLSLAATEALALILATEYPNVADALRHAFQDANDAAQNVDDPVFGLVSTPQGRLHVEVLQQRIDHVREVIRGELGPALGVSQGFNALDGD